MTSPNGLEDVKSKVKKTISKRDFKKLVGEKFSASIRFQGEPINEDEQNVLKEEFKQSVKKNAELSVKGKFLVALNAKMGETITPELLEHLNFNVGKHKLSPSQITETTPKHTGKVFSPDFSPETATEIPPLAPLNGEDMKGFGDD